MTLIEKLRKAIKARGTSQDAIEKATGLTQGRISKWADDKGQPTARQALRLARHFGLSVEYLIDDEIDSPSQVTPTLTPDEELVIRLVRRFGVDAVLGRLMGMERSPALEPEKTRETGTQARPALEAPIPGVTDVKRREQA